MQGHAYGSCIAVAYSPAVLRLRWLVGVPLCFVSLLGNGQLQRHRTPQHGRSGQLPCVLSATTTAIDEGSASPMAKGNSGSKITGGKVHVGPGHCQLQGQHQGRAARPESQWVQSGLRDLRCIQTWQLSV
ncbi:hypothetical protein HaLaN_11375 [Haematococcus lacustris]|uniref:Uncharacterized protein n=1 Tax=Haematococcus lacustris TaxID=44745 RepID=A0A699ZHR9_HAELA|nr:hypothetical protein HaLaN_11375 [Haematococcus lacustris]